ncbi:unnamed protein product [Penicillium salamii]|uniref:Uncharacterized protein n=1 Tax=Penicillium salamii TaxID=1612424 RepID=A0A9W4K185_9EURO|nr:unnamed protein product [Penicillium salamii]
MITLTDSCFQFPLPCGVDRNSNGEHLKAEVKLAWRDSFVCATFTLQPPTVNMGSSPSTISQDVNTLISNPSNQENVHFPRNSDDVLRTFSTLRHVLPSELVLEILEFAQYWLHARVYREGIHTYDERNWRDRTPYLTSEPIAEGRVEEIRIKIWSHDQGWSDYREDHGTYRNSWTWFELGIEGFQGREVNTDDVDLHLATNVHAQRQTAVHEIVYRRQDSSRLIQALRTGDHLSIIPLSRYPGWKNTVDKASIEVYTSPIF